MPRKKHSPKAIAEKPWKVDVLVSQGHSLAEAVRSIGVSQFTMTGDATSSANGRPTRPGG